MADIWQTTSIYFLILLMELMDFQQKTIKYVLLFWCHGSVAYRIKRMRPKARYKQIVCHIAELWF